MNILDRQRQLRILLMVVLFGLGAAIASGESAVPIPGFPEDLTLRAARSAHAPAEPPSITVEEVPAYVTWRENVKHFASMRATYDYESWTPPDCPTRKGKATQRASEETLNIGSGYHRVRKTVVSTA